MKNIFTAAIALLMLCSCTTIIKKEKTISTEATAILAAIASQQERIYMMKGSYINGLENVKNDDMLSMIYANGLAYFTITEIGQVNRLTRKENIPGGLGQYEISLTLPDIPGTALRKWDCNPKPQCEAFLPQ